MAQRADRGYKLYFRYVKIDDVKCGICLECEGRDRRTVIKMKNSNTSGLIKHLRLHHPSMYQEKLEKGGGSAQQVNTGNANMVGCSALGCSNSGPKGFQMFSFPRPKVKKNGQQNAQENQNDRPGIENQRKTAKVNKEEKRRRTWISAVGRPELENCERPFLCEIHFASDAFINKQNGKRGLKETAIPTLHLPLDGPKRRSKLPASPRHSPTNNNNVLTNLVEIDDKSFVEPAGNYENESSCKLETISEGSNSMPETQPSCSYTSFDADLQGSANVSRKHMFRGKMEEPWINSRRVDPSQRCAEIDEIKESRPFHESPGPLEDPPLYLDEPCAGLVKTEEYAPERVVMEEIEEKFRVAGRKYAFDLRDMSRDQRIIVERILSEVIYHGKLGMLSDSSRLVLGDFRGE